MSVTSVAGKLSHAVIMTRVLVTTAAVLSAVAMGVVIWRATCSTCGSEQVPEFVSQPDVSNDENAKAEHMWNAIYSHSVQQGRVSDEHVSELMQYLDAGESYFVRKRALLTMGALLTLGVDASQSARSDIVQGHLQMLEAQDWRLRQSAITNAQSAGLLKNPRVLAAVRSLENDPRSEVANRARRIDWSDPRNGG